MESAITANDIDTFVELTIAGDDGGAMELVEVTPGIAELLLMRNKKNRAVSKATVKKYASDMKAGRWKHPTSEALAIDKNGVLQQGQHRLLAVIESGSTIKFWCNFGSDPGDFQYLDQGKKRSAADILGIEGYGSTKDMAAIARQCLLVRDYSDKPWNGGGAIVSLTAQAVLGFAEVHADIIQWALSQAGQVYKSARVPRTQYGALATIVASYGGSLDEWDEFQAKVRDGAMLAPDDPAFQLRRASLSSGPSVGGGASAQRRMVIVTKAWNAHVEGRQVRLLRWRTNELPIPMPLPSR